MYKARYTRTPDWSQIGIPSFVANRELKPTIVLHRPEWQYDFGVCVMVIYMWIMDTSNK